MLLGTSAARAAPPQAGDCAVLGAAAPPFAAGDLVTVVEAKAAEVSAVWAPALSSCSKPARISGWIPTGDFTRRSGPLLLHETPNGEAKSKLFPWQKVAAAEERDGWTRVSSLEGPVAVSAIRYLKLRSTRAIGGLVITPSELGFRGEHYGSKAICGGHLFTEAASFIQTGDASRPLAVLCAGTFEGEKNYLTLLGTGAKAIALDPGETATISAAALVHALDQALKKR